jgi:hypothetical protein
MENESMDEPEKTPNKGATFFAALFGVAATVPN